MANVISALKEPYSGIKITHFASPFCSSLCFPTCRAVSGTTHGIPCFALEVFKQDIRRGGEIQMLTCFTVKI